MCATNPSRALCVLQLGTDTWFYIKRCFLSLLENMAKHMIMLRDTVVQDCIQFLEHCERECCCNASDVYIMFD